MEGYFRDDAPRMTLTLIGDGGQSDIEFVVDTAFTGMLTAPPFVLATVGAAIDGVRLIQLADGTERRAPFCTVRVEWFGELRIVCATIIDDEPLMGIDLLRGHHLHIEVTEGGEVAVEPL